jgi:ABC-type multidrug transport system permease subunit
VNFLPTVERELRTAARRRSTFGLRWSLAAVGVVAWLGMVVSQPGAVRLVDWNQRIFLLLGILCFVFCLLCGVLLTADALSTEKREGTLGLLFLTDLRGYDVVLGKLAGASVTLFYGLLAIFPVLALSVLAGGLTPAEILRVSLVLGLVLVYSLAVGLAVSAWLWEAQQTLWVGLGIVLAQACLTPVLWLVTAYWPPRSPHSLDIMVPSPIFTFAMAFDFNYRTRLGATQFWVSFATVLAVAVASLVFACRVLPRKRSEEAPVRPARRPGGRGRNVPPGSESSRREARNLELEVNPFGWLAVRDRWLVALVRQGIVWGSVVWLGALLMALGLGNTGRGKGCYIYCLLTAFCLHQAFKVAVAIEACRPLLESRLAGALELLLATPLAVADIIGGQRQAQAQLWRRPFRILAGLNGLLFLSVMLFSKVLGMSRTDVDIFSEWFLGGLAALWVDYWALRWVGMASALQARNQSRAVLITLGRVMAPGWAGLVVPGVLVTVVHEPWKIFALFLVWFTACMINGMVQARFARRALFSEFRLRVVQGGKGQ